jgi:hypothetical protein
MAIDLTSITPNPCSMNIEWGGIDNMSACPTPMITPFAGPNGTLCVARDTFSLLVAKHDAMLLAALCFVGGMLLVLFYLWLYRRYV